MDLSRRHLLRGAAATGAALAASAYGVLSSVAAPTATVRKFTDPLIVPPVVDGTGTVDLTMRNTLHAFHSSLPAGPSLAYQGPGAGGTTYLGPTIVAQQGVPTTVQVTNAITSHPLAAGLDPALHGTAAEDDTSPRTAVHLHGGNTTPESDGGPEDTFTSGSGYTYSYDCQEAAGLWYHDHALGITRLNVHAGLVVDFRNLPAGAVVEMRNAAATPFPGPARTSHKGGANIGSIMQFRVSEAAGWDGTVTTATALRAEPVHRLDAPADAVSQYARRTHSLVELFRPDGTVRMATLNNRTFDNDDYQDRPVTAGSLEVWEFANTTMDSHPIHLHRVQFQVLDREPFDAAAYLAQNYPPDPATGLLEPNTGPYPAPSADGFSLGPAQPPAANEMGWKDTVQTPPGMITRIVVPSGQSAVPDGTIAASKVHTGDYVWHCHILEHEDNDMMQKHRIV